MLLRRILLGLLLLGTLFLNAGVRGRRHVCTGTPTNPILVDGKCIVEGVWLHVVDDGGFVQYRIMVSDNGSKTTVEYPLRGLPTP